jgi:glycosyltransferase involved in cell wall biosynthesis
LDRNGGNAPFVCHPPEQERMQVLLAIDSLGVGGKERQAVELVKGLALVPHVQLRVVCFGPEAFYLSDVKALRIPVEFVVRRVRWDPQVFFTLRKLISAGRPHIIHTNGLISTFYCLPVAKRYGVPLINGSIRNAFGRGDFRWLLEKLLLRASDYRVANSRAGLHSRNFSEQDPCNLVIYNGYDLARVAHIHRGSARQTNAASPNAKSVGMVAEFNRYKDYRTFIEAARILSCKRNDIVFVAVGAGETLADCRAAASDLPTVRFLGERRDIEDIVQMFDVGVLCTFSEGLSNSIMEYMALGKPVVATNAGGTRELVGDGETGLLVEPSNPVQLAEAIERLVDNPRLAARMGRAGFAKLQRELSLPRMIDQTVALYEHIVGSLRATRAARSVGC